MTTRANTTGSSTITLAAETARVVRRIAAFEEQTISDMVASMVASYLVHERPELKKVLDEDGKVTRRLKTIPKRRRGRSK